VIKRRQVAGHAQAQLVEADEENVLMLETPPLERRDDRLDEGNGRGHAGAGVGVDLEAHLALRPGHQFAAARFLPHTEERLDLGGIGGLAK
jgi:hypothetical protein